MRDFNSELSKKQNLKDYINSTLGIREGVISLLEDPDKNEKVKELLQEVIIDLEKDLEKEIEEEYKKLSRMMLKQMQEICEKVGIVLDFKK